MVYLVTLIDNKEINIVADNEQVAMDAARTRTGQEPIYVMIDSWSFFMDGNEQAIADRLNADRLAKSVTAAEEDYMDACIKAIDSPLGRRF